MNPGHAYRGVGMLMSLPVLQKKQGGTLQSVVQIGQQ